MGKSHPNKYLEKYATYKHSITNFDIVHFELSILINHLNELKSIDDIFNSNSSFRLLPSIVASEMMCYGTFDTVKDHFLQSKKELKPDTNYLVFYHFCGSSYYIPISRVGYELETDDSYTKLKTLSNTFFQKEIRYIRYNDLDTLSLQNKQLNLLLLFKNNQFHLILTPHRCKQLSYILNIIHPEETHNCKIYTFPSDDNEKINTLLIKTFSEHIESNK